MSDDWRKRYYRAVLDHLGGSDDVDLSTVKIITHWTEAGGYSEYTNWDSSISMVVSWLEPTRVGGDASTGFPAARKVEWSLTNEEVATLIASFG